MKITVQTVVNADLNQVWDAWNNLVNWVARLKRRSAEVTEGAGGSWIDR